MSTIPTAQASPGTENIDWGFRVLLDGDVRYINTLVINSYEKNSPDTSDSYYAWYVGPDGAVSIFNYHVGGSYGREDRRSRMASSPRI